MVSITSISSIESKQFHLPTFPLLIIVHFGYYDLHRRPSPRLISIHQAQTPTQRLANKRYAQQEAKKMGSLRPPKEDGEVVRPKKSLAKKIQASPVPAWALCKYYP